MLICNSNFNNAEFDYVIQFFFYVILYHEKCHPLVYLHVEMAHTGYVAITTQLLYFHIECWLCMYVCHHVVLLVCLRNLCLLWELHQHYKTPIVKMLGVLFIVNVCSIAICCPCIGCVFLVVCCGILTPQRVTKSQIGTLQHEKAVYNVLRHT